MISLVREMSTDPLSRLFYVSKALANRARLRIVGVLEGRELCVGQVAAIFDIARSTASEHLSELRRVGLLAERRDGKFVYYSLDTAPAARATLDVVLSGLSADAVVQSDRDLAARILALPHDLVCEQGRAALAAEPPPRAPAGASATDCCAAPGPKTGPREVP